MTSAPLGGAAPPIEPPVAAVALQEPTDRVGAGFSTLYTAASIAMWIGFNVPGSVLIAQQLQKIDPANKEIKLSLVLTVGAIVSLFANPMFGAISDLTKGRFGRRRPWALVGGLGGAASLLVLGFGDSVAMLIVGWGLVQLALNILLAVLMAMIPDRVPVTQRGFISALAGLAQGLGTILGLGIVVAMSGGFLAKYGALSAILVVAVVLLVVGTTDPPAPRDLTFSAWFRQAIGTLFSEPGRYRDFGWAWITRFLVMLGYALGTTYLFYYLQDAVHYKDADQGVLILNVVAFLALVPTIFVGGIISDRLQRRKAFVMVSTAVIGSGLLVLGLAQTWPSALAAAALLGAGFGVYLSVDVALITEVLPSAEGRGMELGVINIANVVPQIMAPIICGPVVKYAGGYPVLFGVAAVITLLGAVLVQPIRGVR